MMGALVPALVESITIVPGTRRDSMDGEGGTAAFDLRMFLLSEGFVLHVDSVGLKIFTSTSSGRFQDWSNKMAKQGDQEMPCKCCC